MFRTPSDADLLRTQARHAHFEVRELFARGLFHAAGDLARLADRRLCDVRDLQLPEDAVEEGAVERPFHRFMLFRANSYPARDVMERRCMTACALAQ